MILAWHRPHGTLSLTISIKLQTIMQDYIYKEPIHTLLYSNTEISQTVINSVSELAHQLNIINLNVQLSISGQEGEHGLFKFNIKG